MKIYCVLFDTMPFREATADFAAQGQADLLKQVGCSFTTTTLIQMFTGKLPSDLEQQGIGYHRHLRYLDPATGNTRWPWRKELLFERLLADGWDIGVHNANFFSQQLFDDERIIKSTAFPGGLAEQTRRTWDDSAGFLFQPGMERRRYYERELAFIREAQRKDASRNIFYFIIYHQCHAAVAHSFDKKTAADLSQLLMKQWDLREEDAVFWFFSDHGDWTTMGEHPVHRDYLSWVLYKNNCAGAKPVASKFISACDFFPTIMDACGLDHPKPGNAQSIFEAQQQERIFYMEDGRVRFDKEASTSALACAFVDWRNDSPRELLQTSYFRPRHEFRSARTLLDDFGFGKSSERMETSDGNLVQGLSGRYSWVPPFEEPRRKTVDREYALKALNPHMAAFLSLDGPVEQETVRPLELVTWKRFDVLAKYLYAKTRKLGIDSPWGREIYEAHERAFNNCDEKDGSGKKGIADFLKAFHEVLDAIERKGFDPEVSAVPVSRGNNLIDGSHRLAACLCHDQPLPVLRFDFEGWHYSHDFFRKKGLAERHCDAIAYEYCKLKPNTHIVMLFPSAAGKDDEVRKILLEYSSIFYEKSVTLNNNGPLLLMTQVYRDEPWLGDFSNNFKGARLKASWCFRGEGPMRLFVIETDRPERLKEAKERIRAIYKIENHSVHINDTHRETVLLAQALLNENSIHFLNHASLKKFDRYGRNVALYRKSLQETGDAEQYCVSGSGVLAAYGLRDARDIDYLHFGNEMRAPGDISSHNKERRHYPATIDDIVFNPANHFYFDGVKFASLEIVRRLKELRGEEKDKRDLDLIRTLDESVPGGSSVSGFTRPSAGSVPADQRDGTPALSVVILNYNGLSCIRPCLESLKRNTPEAHEIIVFDNASTDGSLDYLRRVDGITLVEHPVNLGCPPARARALSLARGRYVVFLDNDTIVTRGWSTRLIAHARSNPQIGMLGPRSNYVSGAQLIPSVPYKNIEGLEEFSSQWADRHEGELLPTYRLVGFCMFVTREVIDKIGNIDEAFGKFGFEDDDYTWRSLIAGFKAAIANDVFVHHTGGPQGRGDSSYNRQLLTAWEAFKKKWDLPKDLAYGKGFDLLGVLTRLFDRRRHYVPLFDASRLEAFVFTSSSKKRDDAAPVSKEEYDALQRLVKKEDLDTAIRGIEKLLERHPGSAVLHNDLAVLSQKAGQSEKALLHYEKAISLEPGTIVFRKNLADFHLLVRKDQAHAVQLYQSVLKAAPRDIETLLILGNICGSERLLREATVFFKQVLEIEPENADANAGLEKIEEAGRAARNGKVSIIIVSPEGKDGVRKALESIQGLTPEPHECIVLERKKRGNGKNAAHPSSDPAITSVVLEEGGIVGSLNKAVAASSGEYVVILLDDIAVTKDWLNGMLEALNRESNSGVVGPMIGGVDGRQRAAHPDFESDETAALFAERFRGRNRHRVIHEKYINGACMLFRRGLAEELGGFDENLEGSRFFDDFCLRALLEGYQNRIAGDVFVYCRGAGERAAKRRRLSGTRKKFDQKWTGLGLDTPIGKKALSLKVLDRAEAWYGRDNLDEAVKTLLDGRKRLPSDLGLSLRLVEMLIDAKQFGHALDIANDTPALERDATGRALKGYCLEGLERYDEARECADRALALKRRHAPALNLMGTLSYKQGDKAGAETHFRAALDADPGFGETLTNLGVLRWSRGEREEALDLLEKGFILAPGADDSAKRYHSAIASTGAFDRAEPVFAEARSLHGKNKKLAFFLIDLLLRQGKYAEAMNRIEEALVAFGVDEETLQAAKAVRERVGVKAIQAASRPALSLCMIVKNEEKFLAPCLNSVKEIAGEIIIVDTGSTDRTKDIATVFGARVFDFAWQDDFSSARNYSLSKAEGDWILVLDGDEVIAPEDVPVLSELTKKKKGRDAYAIITRNYTDRMSVGWIENKGEYREEAGGGWYPSDKVRLFPNAPGIRFENPVHELVEASVLKAGMRIRACGVLVHHYGKLNADKTSEKGEAYFLLGMEKLKTRGNDNLKAIYELAVQAGELGRYEDEIRLWERFIEQKPDFYKAYLNLVRAYGELGRWQEALAAGEKALELNPESRESVFNHALALFYTGNNTETIAVLERFREKDPDYPLTLALLSLAYAVDGRKDDVFSLVRRIRKMNFNYAEYTGAQAKKLRAMGREKDALILLQNAIEGNYATKYILGQFSEYFAASA